MPLEDATSSSAASLKPSTRPGADRCLNSTSIRPAIAAIKSVRRRHSSHAVIATPPTHARGARGRGASRGLRERRGVVEAQARGDADVLRADNVGALEVGDGAGDAQDARMAAGGERVAVVELGEQAQGARGDVAD